MKKVAVINYGIGNIGSIINMCKKIDVETIEVQNADDLKQAERIILPGVGSFDHGMSKLHELGLDEAIKKAVLVDKKPLLGICLGMQLLGNKSEEGRWSGLGLIDFHCKKFKFDNDLELKIPHMGWDVVEFNKDDDVLLSDIKNQQRYYFVHSYYAVCEKEENCLMTCDYEKKFVAVVKKNNIYGVQFHPEKSHQFGMKLLKNFVEKV
ncbi:MAG: imidazole glycerol phosphate synthase subunit HisH [Streptococcaceae bacterium]|jgi:glutamine amidotransferase|nr:imidazole glycerol phosphate synthase subunit HisH [Streptococcaceae bacterium]